jgi:predicted nucleic acid-binding protein
MIYLLDTSALLAHYRDEDGAPQVQALFEDGDASIARQAFVLGLEANSRLPLSDALIAAAAQSIAAVLVHRDPHFAALQPESIKQKML